MTYFWRYPHPPLPPPPQHFKVSRSQLQNVIEWELGVNLIYFVSYLTDVLNMTNFFALPQNF